VGFAGWLRQNSEHYLMVDAQRRMAQRYGRSPPRPEGWRDRFWLDVFAPTYRRLPWRLRRFTIQLMPGSHRQAWTPPPRRGTPAVGPDGTVFAMARTQTQSAEQQTVPERRGE
jgi:hypothetical protein